MNGECSRSDESSGPCKLALQYLKNITDNFSEERLIGEGGFGKVYKGVRKDETIIAVKRLQPSSNHQVQEKQFLNEVNHLMKLKHPNVVQLVGYCFETDNDLLEYKGKGIFAENQQRLLCLEYLPNGSLDTYISEESSGLDWRQRYKIIKGICFGLHYLHEECQNQFNASIIHMDLKPENILLDYNMVPKIADFGLSRLFDDEKTHTVATSLVGSLGYMAPEYHYNRVITTKADIYSLGVIIFKVISGRMFVPYEQSNFIGEVLQAWRNRLVAAHCASLETDCKHIKICLEIAKSCIELNPKERPEITAITQMLTKWESRNNYVSGEEKQLADKDYMGVLITYIYRDLGFSNGHPIAAIVIYMCLLQWKTFQAETTDVYNRIMHSVGSATEAQGSNNKLIAYWLSNISTLTVFLEWTLKVPVGYTANVKMKRARATSTGIANRPRIETKYPTQLFKNQLVEFLEKFYRMIRNNLKTEISPLLGLVIQASITSNASTRSDSGSNVSALQTPMDHWQGIAEILTNYLNVLKTNHVPLLLINKIFAQVFSFIDVQLFNNLVLQRASCSYNNVKYLQAGLAELEQWCINVTKEYAGSSWDELKHVWQAAEFLIIQDKPKKTLQEITDVLCPMLNIQQIYRISSENRTKYGTKRGVSDLVLESMRKMTLHAVKEGKRDLLLIDDSSIPFSVDDITKSLTELEVTDVDIPPSILENCGLPTRNQTED